LIQSIAFYTSYPHLQQGKLFSSQRAPGSYPSRPFVLLKRELAAKGLRVFTYDQVQDKAALNAVVFLDLPASPSVIHAVKANCPRAVVILYILESPAHHPGQFSNKNHDHFDHVVSYKYSCRDNLSSSFCPIPFDDFSEGEDELTDSHLWNKRRLLCSVNTRKRAGFLCDSGKGPLHRFGVRGFGEPWHTPALKLFTQWSGYQYNLRNSWVQALDLLDLSGSLFDVYGRGWEGAEPIGYYERFIKAPTPIRASKGVFKDDKLRLLSKYRYTLVFENVVGGDDYVSEKLFEAIAAGCVPIYWGDAKLVTLLPAGIFIDGRCFEAPIQLLQFLLDESEEEWADRQRSIRVFKKDRLYCQRTPEGFSRRMTEILCFALGV
jgi:alpha(1,3/1,4) fucosyltransferase